MRLTRILICMAICSCCCSCTTVPPEPLSREINLTPDDNGRQIQAYIGQVLVVTLPATPSTGYTWDVTDTNNDMLRQVNKSEFVPDSNLEGSPGKLIMRFEVVGSGSIQLKLAYHQPWKTGEKPASTFTIKVSVSPAAGPFADKNEEDKGATTPSVKPSGAELPK